MRAAFGETPFAGKRRRSALKAYVVAVESARQYSIRANARALESSRMPRAANELDSLRRPNNKDNKYCSQQSIR